MTEHPANLEPSQARYTSLERSAQPPKLKTLDYSVTRVPKPFRLSLLCVAAIGPLLALLIPLVCPLFYSRYFALPAWTDYAGAVGVAIVGTGFCAAIYCICTFGRLVRSSKNRWFIFVGLIWAIFGPILAQFTLIQFMEGLSHHVHPYQHVSIQLESLNHYLHKYTLEHDKAYPPHLAALILEDPAAVRALEISAGEATQPYKLPAIPPSNGQQLASDIDQKCIFVYTASDLVEPVPMEEDRSLLDSNIIFAYTKELKSIPNHRILLFPNRYPTLIPDADLPKYFAASNAARAKLNLPPFTLDGPPPSPPPAP